MKKPFSVVILSLLISSSLIDARTWRSADGSKTFEGTYKSYDPETKTVSVLINGRLMEFSEDKLSADDIAFLQEKQKEAEANRDPLEQISATVVGEQIAGAKLHRLNGKRFKKAAFEKVPEYYLLYYSASW